MGAVNRQRIPLQPLILFLAACGFVHAQTYDLAWSPDGKLVAFGAFKNVLVASASQDSATLGFELRGAADAVRAVAFSKDGSLLAAAGGLPGRGGEVQIWNVADRKLLHTIKGHSDCIYGVAFSPDGKTLATSSYDKLIKLWDLATGKEIRTFKDHIDAVYAVAFTPDGKRLVSGGADRTVKIWNVDTGERLYTLSDPQDGVNTIALDPAGKYVAAAGLDKTIRIWSLGDKSAKLENSLIASEDAILKLSWSADGKRLAAASADKTVTLYSTPDLSQIASYPEPDWVYALQFSPDSTQLAIKPYDKGALSLRAMR